jgi:GNAT superfamily N-acetyltransferase
MIRPAGIDDTKVIQEMVRELAEHEDQLHTVITDAEELRAVLFGEDALSSAFVAVDDATGQIVGYTLWCPVYSTWRGSVAQIDDIYVRDEAKGQGYEKALIGHVAREAVARGYHEMQWWGMTEHVENTAFYRSFGADYDGGLVIFRINDAALAALGAEGQR